jgi:hypothetical protein
MAEYYFSNPYLEDIYNSITRMQKQVDYVIGLFSKMLEILNRRDNMQVKEAKNMIKKDQIRLEDLVSYENPISLKPFGELENPVIDSEGYFREKDEPEINRGIYSRALVTITESSDIKKVQFDYRNLQSKVDNLTSMAEKFFKKMDEYDLAWEHREELWKKEDVKWIEQQKEWIEKQKEWIEKQKEWAEKEKRWDKQEKQFELQKKEMILNIDDKDKQLRGEKNKINKLIDENLRLTHQLEEKSKILDNVKSEYNRIHAKLELKEWKEQKILPSVANGIPRNTYLGFKHTIFDEYFPTEKLENRLRMFAYEGNNSQIQSFLKRKRNSNLVNGRGMPDSLGSTVKSWQDKTALMLASQEGHLDCVKTLLKYGANPNYLDRDNLTALDYAQKGWHKRISNILRENEGVNGIDLFDKFHLNSPKGVELTKR